MYFDLFFALCFLIGVHGFNTTKILIILSLNYAIVKNAPVKTLPAATWIFNIGVLFLNEWFDGYRFGHIHELGAHLVCRLEAKLMVG
jgi:protein-cysteine N-palmitoyltransferase HHAT